MLMCFALLAIFASFFKGSIPSVHGWIDIVHSALEMDHRAQVSGRAARKDFNNVSPSTEAFVIHSPSKEIKIDQAAFAQAFANGSLISTLWKARRIT